ncbi:MAG: hypothetical protein ACYTEX_22115 [Planctomycetota bacterium]|jgi:hypothetical protein
MRIRFLETRLVKDGSGTTFEKGEIYDLPTASAEHWLRRGVAEKVAGRPKKIVETAAVTPSETAQGVAAASAPRVVPLAPKKGD